MDDRLVSIIIPVFNRASLLPETLDSVLLQTHQQWECLIIDDGSTDATPDVARQFVQKDSRFQYHHRPDSRLKGANACRNYGLELSNGGFVNWLDSDDILTPDHLISHLALHNDLIDASVSIADVFVNDPNFPHRPWSQVDFKHEDFLTAMIESRTAWSINNVLWKRNSLPRKPFSEVLASSQEWTFHLQQIARDAKYASVNNITCHIREHDNRIGKSLSEQKIYSTYKSRRIIIEELATLDKLSPRRELALLKPIFLALRQSIQYKYADLNAVIFAFLESYSKKSMHRFAILKVLLIAVPIYKLTRRGERLFSTKI